jgi:hypothetical protein
MNTEDEPSFIMSCHLSLRHTIHVKQAYHSHEFKIGQVTQPST